MGTIWSSSPWMNSAVEDGLEAGLHSLPPERIAQPR
jgi:hypothetical protein